MKGRERRGGTRHWRSQFMTPQTNCAPELLVQTWFNTDRPLTLAGLPSEINLGAFSHLGTVDGTANLPIPQQP